MNKGLILVTGGTGYIGSHTVVELQQSGFEVVIIDSLFNSDEKVLDRIESITGKRPKFVNLDLCNREDLVNFFEQSAPIQAIIHFAAFKAVGDSVKKPVAYYRNNLDSLLGVLEGMDKHHINNLVFSSSCTVYGNPDKLPVDENAPVVQPESPYGNTKKICEEILSDTCRANPSLSVISLRYFNPIGAHESAEIGELPTGVPTNLMPFITQTAAGIRQYLSVFGSDYDTPDGTCIRDYIHVVDIAKAHVVAVERLLASKQTSNYEVFNLGTGRGNTVLEVIQSFEKTSGQKLNYKLVDRREGDVVKIYASTDKANNVLGWKANLDLDQMTNSAWQWQLRLAKK